MAISIKNNQFHLTTKNKSYIFCVYNDAFLVHIYWGDRIENDIDMTDFPEELIYPRTNAFHVATNTTNKMFLSDLQLEYAYAVGDYRVPSFVAKYENNSTVTEFEYISHKVYHGKNRVNGLPTTIGDDNTDTLEVELSDKLTGLTVYLIYSVFENYDVITRSVRYENRGESDIHLLSAQSACIDFSGQNYKILHLHGDWSRERFVEYTDVKHGIFTIDSKRGMSSHMNNPFFALMDKNADEIKGEVYGFCLMYSGNFCADIEGSSCGTTRVTMGINPYNFDWTLKKNEVFNTPEVVMVHTSNGLGEMSCKYHKLIRDRVCKGKWADKERPVIANNWDGMRFDFNEEKLYSLVERAAEVGVEMFVLDDGWFGKRNNNRCSLGDWTINKDKFPNGLADFVNSVNSYGMKFGL